MFRKFPFETVTLKQGDLTNEKVDAIVNAANSSLMGGGGVDGAIHRAGGSAILEECKMIVQKIGRLPPGEAVITTGGDLPAPHVIHTVGPIWRGGGSGEEVTLHKCYRHSLELARKEGLRSVAFPSISTGAYGYPVDIAATVAITTVLEFLDGNGEGEMGRKPLDVTFVLFDPRTLAAYMKALKEAI